MDFDLNNISVVGGIAIALIALIVLVYKLIPRAEARKEVADRIGTIVEEDARPREENDHEHEEDRQRDGEQTPNIILPLSESSKDEENHEREGDDREREENDRTRNLEDTPNIILPKAK